jgi:hypothetical protein
VAGGFRNLDPEFTRPSGWTRWSFIARRMWDSLTAPRTFEAPRVANDGAALRAQPSPRSITWVGHATLLVQVDGLSVLTDPNWSERAGPTSWIGARRLNAPGVAFDVLPRIDVVTISNRIQTIDLQVFLSQGIDPTAKSVLVVKSVQHYRAAYAPIAREIVLVDSGGICSPDISRLKFTKLRRPIWPLDGVNDPYAGARPA